MKLDSTLHQSMERILALWGRCKYSFGVGIRKNITVVAENRKEKSFVLDYVDIKNGIDESKVIEKLSRNCLDFMSFYDVL